MRYPFGKYDQLFVPEFNAGAMENVGAVTFREDYVFRSKVTRYHYERRCETVLHEMAHMWFGDLVTMRWWDDLWLNESFATWASVVAQVSATEYSHAWTTFANVEKSWAYVQDQLPSTHPIAADIVDLAAVEVNFDGITYAKGASVLKQLAAYVGYDEFLAGLRDYFAAHAFGNATLDDLLSALTAVSGRDLKAWSAQWLETTGLNTLTPVFDVDADGLFTSFAIAQTPAEPGAGELRRHRVAVGVYDDDDQGRLVRVHRVELDVADARTEVPDLVGASRGKLILVNDDDLTYCKPVLDPDSLVTAVERIGDIAGSLPRTLVWSAVWEMTRDARMRARDFVDLALNGLPGETEIGVVMRVLQQVSVALSSYADPAWAAAVGWPKLTDALVALARAAEPGSDRQLAAVNALAGSVLSDAQLDLVAGWLDGTDPLPGLKVDTDLAWTLLSAQVAHGRAGNAAIEQAAARDRTASGERRAATASPCARGPRRSGRSGTGSSGTTAWPTPCRRRPCAASGTPPRRMCWSSSPTGTSTWSTRCGPVGRSRSLHGSSRASSPDGRWSRPRSTEHWRGRRVSTRTSCGAWCRRVGPGWSARCGRRPSTPGPDGPSTPSEPETVRIHLGMRAGFSHPLVFARLTGVACGGSTSASGAAACRPGRPACEPH